MPRPLVSACAGLLLLGCGAAALARPAAAQATGPLYGPAQPLYRYDAQPARPQAPTRLAPRGGYGYGYGYGYGNDGYQQRYRQPPARIVCDPYGRCWRDQSYGGGNMGFTARPPGWADDLPGRLQQPDRFVRPRSGVVCDQGTSLCYKDGRIDKSETADLFGERAADRVDDVRDRGGTGRVFVPEPGVTCDAERQACFDGRFADPSLTRRYFGRGAADRLD